MLNILPNPSPSTESVLIIVEKRELSSEIEPFLANRGYIVDVVTDVSKAINSSPVDKYATIIVDIDTSRSILFNQLRELRDSTDAIIIVSTDNPDEHDRIICLEIAADDYLVKPYSARELVARMHANARRYARAVQAESPPREQNAELSQSKLSLAGLLFNADGTDLKTTDGREIKLTHRELQLFSLLIANADREVTLDEISWHIYQSPCSENNRSKFTMLMHRLRQKLTEYSTSDNLILCSHNKGYRFAAKLEEAQCDAPIGRFY